MSPNTQRWCCFNACLYSQQTSILDCSLRACSLAGLPDVFGNAREQMRREADAEKDVLYKQIRHVKVELDFLKKRAGLIA